MRSIKLMLKPFGYILMIEACFMGICLLMELFYHGSNIDAFVLSFFVSLFFGLMFVFTSIGTSFGIVSQKNKMVLVLSSWLACIPFGILPYMMSNLKLGYSEAIFEFMSALTTTSCTLFLHNPDVSVGLKMWHTLIAGIGGIGVIIIYFIFLSNSSDLTNGLNSLARKDFSNEYTFEPIVIKNLIAKIIITYLSIILLCFFCYVFSGMGILDSFSTAIATVSTSGFVHNNDGFVHVLDTDAKMMIATFFMILSSVPLILIFASIEKRSLNVFRVDQVYWFFVVVAIMLLIFFAKVYPVQSFSIKSIIVQGLFYSSSSITTTGFGLEGLVLIKASILGIMCLSPIIGGCSGSTAGGLKISRIVVVFKAIGIEIDSKISPKNIMQVKMNGKNIEKQSIDSSILMFATYFLSVFIFTVFVSLYIELDFSRSFFFVVSLITNSGLTDVTILSNNVSNIVDKNIIFSISSAIMLIGRVELFAIYFLFSRKLWSD